MSMIWLFSVYAGYREVDPEQTFEGHREWNGLRAMVVGFDREEVGLTGIGLG